MVWKFYKGKTHLIVGNDPEWWALHCRRVSRVETDFDDGITLRIDRAALSPPTLDRCKRCLRRWNKLSPSVRAELEESRDER